MTAPAQPGKPTGGFLKAKWGPLPAWVWMALGLGAALAYSAWQKAKAGTSSAASSTDTSAPDQTPPQVFQTYVTLNDFDTDPAAPPAAGRPVPPTGPPTAPPPGPIGIPPIDHKPPTPGPAPVANKGQWVTVSKYTTKNPPWNSTLYGIAAHLLGNGTQWPSVWNNSQNAALKSRRKDPKNIQPGDRIWVPSK